MTRHNQKRVKSKRDSEVSDRRRFLKVAGAGLVAASIPTAGDALTGAQKGDDGPSHEQKNAHLSARLWLEPRAAGGLRWAPSQWARQ